MITEDYKAYFRHLASGVCIVTFSVETGVHGFTATSVTSVCAAPPTVLFCVRQQNDSFQYARVGSPVGISILSKNQIHLSERFARKIGAEGYEDVETISMPRGVPTLKGAIARMEGVIIDVIPVSDHAIVLVEFEAAHITSGDMPVLYYDRGYHHPVRI
ncbi:flavin reductase family protein [Methylobacterium sp. J-088]|uniref:flavin reductase family protein n=1 Tax=Methylobacterium sp. J-088 TaxID=2836664 RepID=UPI001FBBFCC9|nr:flavin reductase family protein [Methylobacterium sp. J-088]MCJ2062988.1 flavin reductase family protein [Methylobacterium sp. J-088]